MTINGPIAQLNAKLEAERNPNQKLGPLQREWVKELRTTFFPQGRGNLGCRVYGYCCLGIAHMILNPEHRGHSLYNRGKDSKGHVLSVFDTDRLGLSKSGQDNCTNMNDGELLTFKEIADELENNPAKFFDKEK